MQKLPTCHQVLVSMVVSVMTLSLRSSMQVTLTGLDSRKLRKTVGKHYFWGILGCLEGAGDAKIWSWNGPGRSWGTFWRPAGDFRGYIYIYDIYIYIST